MALDFPSSPANGQIYTSNSRAWMWDASANAWVSSVQTVSPPPYVALSLSANTANLVNTTWTSLAFDTEDSDADGWHAASNTRIEIGRTGNYVITSKAFIYQQADMGAYATYLGIAVNGALIAWDYQAQRVPGSYVNHSVTAGAYLTAGQYVETQAYSQYLSKVLSNSTIRTSMTLVGTGATGPTGNTGATGNTGSPTAWTEQQDVTGTSTQNTNNLSLNSNAAVLNYTSIHASNNYLTGITGGTPGRRLVVRNGQTNSSLYLMLQTENASSTDTNRILTHRFSPIEIGNGRAVELLYVNGTNRWVVTQTSAG